MRARRLVSMLATALLAAAWFAPATHAAPDRTTIYLHVDLTTGVETFTATGGVICAAGSSVSDTRFAGGGVKGRGVFTFHVIKTVTCADGMFHMKVEAAGTPTSGGAVGGFSIIDGAGAYVRLQGAGHVDSLGWFDPDTGHFGVDDVYVGTLRIGG